MSTSNQTHDHQVIRKWAEERGGVPARVKGTERNGDEGLLRIHFPEYGDSKELEQIGWENFFKDFEKDKLDFLYQDKKEDGQTSTFHKLVSRNS